MDEKALVNQLFKKPLTRIKRLCPKALPTDSSSRGYKRPRKKERASLDKPSHHDRIRMIRTNNSLLDAKVLTDR
jgi:hypothetical protein